MNKIISQKTSIVVRQVSVRLVLTWFACQSYHNKFDMKYTHTYVDDNFIYILYFISVVIYITIIVIRTDESDEWFETTIQNS